MVDRNLIKHFRQIQESELQTWKGLNVKFTLRPGLGELIMGSSGLGGNNGALMGAGSGQGASSASNQQFSSFAGSSGGAHQITHTQINNISSSIITSSFTGGPGAGSSSKKPIAPGQVDFFED